MEVTPGRRARVLVPRSGDEVIEPIVVPNSLWRGDDPTAYRGGEAGLEVTHLARVEASGEAYRNDARWGALDIVPTKADYILDPLRMNSLWPLLSGLACCAFAMIRSQKVPGPMVGIGGASLDPKWCRAMGDCTSWGGGNKRGYATVQGIDRVLPVDVYVPGCPPRPEGLIYGMMKLQQLVKQRRGHWDTRAVGPSVPERV